MRLEIVREKGRENWGFFFNNDILGNLSFILGKNFIFELKLINSFLKGEL